MGDGTLVQVMLVYASRHCEERQMRAVGAPSGGILCRLEWYLWATAEMYTSVPAGLHLGSQYPVEVWTWPAWDYPGV